MNQNPMKNGVDALAAFATNTVLGLVDILFLFEQIIQMLLSFKKNFDFLF